MKSETNSINIMKTIFISCFALVLFYFLFSNARIIASITMHYGYPKLHNKEDIKDILKGFPAAFEEKFAVDFKQRNDLTSFHDNMFLNIFRENYSSDCYISYPKETELFFLSSYSNGINSKNRYNLFFDILKGGYGDIDQNAAAAKERLLAREAFFETSPIPAAVLLFPTKHYLEYERIPHFIRKTLGSEVYDNPVQLRVYTSLPEEFREKYIINLFPDAVRENGESPLFPQHNFHWIERSRYTNWAAYRIARKFGVTGVSPVDLDEYRIENVESDIKHMTNISLGDMPFPRIPLEKYSGMGIQMENIPFQMSHNINPEREGKIIVFGDSFSEQLGKDLGLYFNEVWTFSNLDFNKDNVAFVQNEFKPDYMVFISFQGLLQVHGIIDRYIDLSNQVTSEGE